LKFVQKDIIGGPDSDMAQNRQNMRSEFKYATLSEIGGKGLKKKHWDELK
jgi:hypothetical protein